MKLPDMEGLKVLELVKKLSPRTRTIVVTGYVDQGIFDEAERLGRDALLQKPFDLEVLKSEVDRLLNA
jgi:DNA-binding NtrC family response regulator